MDKRKLVRALLWDVGLPAVVYYGGRALGYDVLPALAAGGVGLIHYQHHDKDGGRHEDGAQDRSQAQAAPFAHSDPFPQVMS